MKNTGIFSRILALVLAITLCVGGVTVTALAAGEATAFNNAVTAAGALDTATKLDKKYAAIVEADKALEAYLALDGKSASDSAVKSNVATLKTIKTEVYIACAELAYEHHEDNDYPNTRKYLDCAEYLYSGIDQSNSLASSQYSVCSKIAEELKPAEEICEAFILHVQEALEATSYEVKNAKYESACNLEGDITLDEYEGLAEAIEALVVIEDQLLESILSAREFKNAVDNIFAEKNVLVGVNKARVLYREIDPTIEGVPEAKARLDSIAKAHSSSVKAGNKAFKSASGVIYGLILNDTPSSSSEMGFDFGGWINDLLGQIPGLT